MKTKSLFLAATLMLTASAGASAAVGDTFEIDGLLYTVLTESDGNNTVSIKAHPYAFTLSGTLVIPETTNNNGIEYTVTTLPTIAFQYCTGLTSASIPASVKSIAYNSFYRCANISEFLVDENNETYCSVDGVIYSKDMKTLITCPNAKSGEFTIPDGVETIGENALNGCAELTGIIIPESVTTAKQNCFYLCTSLETINIPAALTCPDDGTPLGRCSSLKEIIVSEENEQLCAVDGVLYSKDMASLIQWPPAKEGEIKIPESVTTIKNFSFCDCESLHTINISKDVTTIGNGAFCYCPNLSEFTVDEDNANYCAVDGIL
ncbi:MAG: leucine-rich repeat domain-containing protein, partial [Paramuribaculum sp.]|nr:leucine-rich repeat domain-containing protein [Paramuribaculum sp.]